MGDTVKRGRVGKVNCHCCNKTFEARFADMKRGWGKYCSKSCKAIDQMQLKPYRNKRVI